jgi:hypothetical protein
VAKTDTVPLIRYLARLIQPDLARLQVPAMPDGVCVRGQDGKAAKAAGGRPTLDVNHPVDGKLKDLNPPELEELELTSEGSAAELPETKIPLGKRLGQLVEVTGAQRLQEHEPSPVATFHRRSIAVFRLDRTPSRASLEELEEKRPRPTTS